MQTDIISGMNRFFFLLPLAALLFISPVMAQEPDEAVPAIAPSMPEANNHAVAEDLQAGEVTVMKDDYAGANYATPNMQNLSKLYWRLGVFNPDDKKIIDNYLIINECDVYRNFYRDDFEWANVRDATRDMLMEKSAGFTNQFKILVPIDLGRYDMERGGFDVVNNTAFINSRRIQVTGTATTYGGCDQKGDLAGYPSNVVMILNKPFTFDFVKVDEHVAQAFLLRKRYNATPVPRELRNKGFQRLAFARMRVTFVRYQGTNDLNGGVKQAIIYGRLDGIDVFEDLKEEMLLTSINYD